MTGSSLFALRPTTVVAARALATLVLAMCVACVVVLAAAPKEYSVTGMVVGVDSDAGAFTASIREIPNFMQAMTMPFEVRDGRELQGLAPGVVVTFTLVVDGAASHAERLRIVRYENTEQDPFSANRLRLLSDLASAGSAPRASALELGAVVPDFTLVDQRRRNVSLSQFRGKVVVANFIYTTCALPTYCLRLANNFGVLQKRFEKALGKDLVLLTVTFDPVHDTPDVMARYAAQWNADPSAWRFLTGPPVDVERACRLFGVHAFSNEGLFDHSLHTVVIGRDGRLAANIEGNQFTATQLGDVVAGAIATTVSR